MAEKLSERRLAENQVIFRQNNQKIVKGLQALRKAAKAEGHGSLAENIDIPLHFYCECSNEDCLDRIVLKPSEYVKLHKNVRQFIIMPGHDLAKIEDVVLRNDNFIVVEKHETPPPTDGKLNPTDLVKP